MATTKLSTIYRFFEKLNGIHLGINLLGTVWE